MGFEHSFFCISFSTLILVYLPSLTLSYLNTHEFSVDHTQHDFHQKLFKYIDRGTIFFSRKPDLGLSPDRTKTWVPCLCFRYFLTKFRVPYDRRKVHEHFPEFCPLKGPGEGAKRVAKARGVPCGRKFDHAMTS